MRFSVVGMRLVQCAIGRVQELGDGKAEAEGVGEFFAVNEVSRRIGNPSACGEMPLGCDVVDGDVTCKASPGLSSGAGRESEESAGAAGRVSG